LEWLEARVVPAFIAPRAFDAPGGAVAVGDFARNGISDLAIVNQRNNSVSVLLGNGDGSFGPARDFPAGLSPSSPVVGDFTGNGILDIAVANFGSNTGSILLGNGDGTFQAPLTFTSAGPRLTSIAVGHFSHSGHLDLVVGDRQVRGGQPGSVSVLAGNGDGTFGAPRSVGLPAQPGPLVVGDFNGDGVSDVAVANVLPDLTANTESLLLGNGDGTLQAPRNFTTLGPTVSDLAVGNFAHDGHLDLVVTNFSGAAGGPHSVSVYPGHGDGTFGTPITSPAGLDPQRLTVADFNHDGNLDLVADDGARSTVLLGQGDGSFQVAGSYTVVGYTAAADFTGDGIPDLVVVDYNSGTASILVGNGDGTFQAAPSFDAGGTPVSVVTGDFNGDGIPDLAFSTSPNSQSTSSVSVLLGNGDGTFGPAVSYPVGFNPGNVVVGDFTGSGILDLAVPIPGNYPDPGSVEVLLGNGDGTFQPPIDYPVVGNPNSLAVGHFSHSGALDLVANDMVRGNVSVLPGNGDGTFGSPIVTPGLFAGTMVVEDFNRDGISDLVYVTSTGARFLDVALGNGDGTFGAPAAYESSASMGSIAVGDFTGNGVLDLAFTTEPAVFAPFSVDVLLGNGDGTFGPPVSYPIGPTAGTVVAADFNGDGILDLAVNRDGTVQVLPGNGDGTFRTSPVRYAAAAGVNQTLAAADLNGDGSTDLVVTDPFTNQVVLLLNDGVWGGMAPGGGSPAPRPGAAGLASPDWGLVTDPGEVRGLVTEAGAGRVPAQLRLARSETTEFVPVLARLEHHALSRRWLTAAEESLPEEGLTGLPD
jgi:hypothetical protein